MKIQYSPLSIGGILFILVGLYFIIAMLRGGYPSIVLFIILPLGIIMLVTDYFLRRSGLAFSTKLVIQIIGVLVPIILGYLFFSGKLR